MGGGQRQRRLPPPPPPLSSPSPNMAQVENPSVNITSFLWSCSAQKHLEKLPESRQRNMSYIVRASDSPGFFPLSLQSGLFAEMVSEDWQESEGEILSPHTDFGEKRVLYL